MSTNSCGGIPGYDAWKLRAPEDEPGYYDQDERLCTDCGGWFDALEADEEGRCPRCATGIGVGGSSGCAGPNCEEG